MENEFIPYEQVLALKELGFDEPCFGYWNIDPYLPKPTFNLLKPFEHEWCLPAPLYQQAFRWFREKYNSHHSITRLPQGALDADNKNNKVLKKYAWFISKDDLNPTIPNDGSGKCDTYEEAELECLKKLIEIIKTK